MSIIKYPFVLVMAFSLVFMGGEAEAKGKHGSDKTRSRVLKEMSSRHGSYKTRHVAYNAKPATKAKSSSTKAKSSSTKKAKK